MMRIECIPDVDMSLRRHTREHALRLGKIVRSLIRACKVSVVTTEGGLRLGHPAGEQHDIAIVKSFVYVEMDRVRRFGYTRLDTSMA